MGMEWFPIEEDSPLRTSIDSEDGPHHLCATGSHQSEESENFPHIMDVKFTASMEDRLDMIEEGKVTRRETLEDFYAPFKAELEKAGE